jgi:aryl-alcohol dehydrogenase-like predicted oxidoreductase
VPEPGPVTRPTVRAAVDRARARLGVERIDLLQFHTWAYDDPSWMDALFYLQELKEEGAIGALGLTNFDAAHLRVACASGVEIATNQVAYSLLDRRAAGDLVRSPALRRATARLRHRGRRAPERALARRARSGRRRRSRPGRR